MLQLDSLPSVKLLCSIPDCGRAIQWRKMCCTHYYRWLKTGNAGGAIRPQAKNGSGSKRSDGYIAFDIGGKKKMAHVLAAEIAIGKPLPPGAEVHHVDEDRANNALSNLVVCPDVAYHKLLHQRQRAFDACGRYDWRKCQFCQKYDDPKNLWTSRKKAYHTSCDTAAAALRRKLIKATHHAL